MKWEVVIGLETHAQLSTASKIFSGASTAFGAAPNTQASAVDIALPGVLPVLNSGAVERAIRFGLAVGGDDQPRAASSRARTTSIPTCRRATRSRSTRFPSCRAAALTIVSPTRGEMRVRLTRAHLEEDAGKSLHEDFHGMTGIDLNRAGTPLLEIVSEPDMRSADEAVAYAKALHALVRWIGICDGNMQEGSFRCDANVSVRPQGETQLGTRCEIKNLNSFRFMQRGDRVRGAPPDRADRGRRHRRAGDAPLRSRPRARRARCAARKTRRTTATFPIPDLPPLVIDSAWIERVRRGDARAAGGDAGALRRRDTRCPRRRGGLLASSRERADYFEATVRRSAASAKLAANWIAGRSVGRAAHAPTSTSRGAPVRAARLPRC